MCIMLRGTVGGLFFLFFQEAESCFALQPPFVNKFVMVNKLFYHKNSLPER